MKQISGRGWNWNYSCDKRALNRLNFAETKIQRGTASKLDSVDDFNWVASFSAHFNLDGNLHPALGRSNFQCLHVGLYQISRHLRCKPTVVDFGLSATLWREFQRIHFSSHGTFCRNSCARKIRRPPRFYW
jgi:hypothetical protein